MRKHVHHCQLTSEISGARLRVRSGLTSQASVRPKLFVINQTRGDTCRDEFHKNSQEPIERERERNRQNHVPAEAVHHGQHDSHIQAVAKPLPQARLAFLVALHVDQREEWCEYQHPHPKDPHHLLHLGFRPPHSPATTVSYSRVPPHIRRPRQTMLRCSMPAVMSRFFASLECSLICRRRSFTLSALRSASS